MITPHGEWHVVENDRQFNRWCNRRGIEEASRSLPLEYPALVRVAEYDGVNFPEFSYLREINKMRWMLIRSALHMNNQRARRERRAGTALL